MNIEGFEERPPFIIIERLTLNSFWCMISVLLLYSDAL